MVSKTAKTETIRKNKVVKKGRKRKSKIAINGSTKSQIDLFGSDEPNEK